MASRFGRLAAAAARAGAVLGTAGGRGGGTGTAGGTYVAVGASETAGIGADRPVDQAWPTVLHRTAMEGTPSYANLGIPGITVAGALARELPDALRLEPTVATVWLNVNDIVRLVPPSDYERDLGALVRSMRRGGRTTVLVANTPALDALPAYRACLAAAPAGMPPGVVAPMVPDPAVLNSVVAAYNAAIETVVRAAGAVLVDLHAAGMEARGNGTEAALISGDGFHPSAAGHELVARTFAAALRSAG